MGYLDGYYESSLYGHTGGPQAFPFDPSAKRYAPEVGPDASSGPRPAGPVRTDIVSQENANWQYNMELARQGSEDADFALHRAREYRDRMHRMVIDGDVEGLKKTTAEVDQFVADHPGLRNWTNLQHNGREGRELSALLSPMVDGGYKTNTVWLGTAVLGRDGSVVPQGTGPSAGASIQAVMDTRDPERLATRATTLSDRMSLPEDVARAMIDPSDEKYGLYHGYADLASPLPETATAQDYEARNQRVRLLSDIINLDKDHRGLFESARDERNFVTATIAEFAQKNGVNVIGRDTLGELAKGYADARTRGQSAADYVREVAAIKDGVMALYKEPGAPDGAGKSDGRASVSARMSEHAAMSYAMSTVRAMNKLEVQGSIAPEVVRDAVVAAADAVNKASTVFGLDLRLGPEEKLSDRVAHYALKRLGVAGADDKGLGQFVADATDRLGLLLSGPTLDAVRVTLGKRGETEVSSGKVPNPYMDTELAVLKAAGRALFELSYDNGRFVGVARAIQRLGDNSDDASSRMQEAMAGAMEGRFADKKLAELVASDLVGNLLGQEGARVSMTVETSLGRHARYLEGRVDPSTGAVVHVPSVPDPAVVKPGTPSFDSGERRALLDGNLIATKRGLAENRIRLLQQMAGRSCSGDTYGDTGLPKSRSFWQAMGQLCDWWTSEKDPGASKKYPLKSHVSDAIQEGYFAKWMHHDYTWMVKQVDRERDVLDQLDAEMLRTIRERKNDVQIDRFTAQDSDLLVQYCLVPDTRTGVRKWLADPRTWFWFTGGSYDHRKEAVEFGSDVPNRAQTMLAIMMNKRNPSVSVGAWTNKFLDAKTASDRLELLATYAPEVLEDSRLIASGLLSKKAGGGWDLTPKDMLSKMQRESYDDKGNDVRANTPVASPGDSEDRREAVQVMESARRVLSTYGGRDLWVQRSMDRVKEHVMLEGMPPDLRREYLGYADARLAQAARSQGLHGLESLTTEFLARRHHHLPNIDTAMNAPNSERFVPMRTLATDAEYAEACDAVRTSYYKKFGKSIPEEIFSEADAWGAAQRVQYLSNKNAADLAGEKYRQTHPGEVAGEGDEPPVTP